MIGHVLIALLLHPMVGAAVPAAAPRTTLDQRPRRTDTQVFFTFLIHGDDSSNPDQSASVVRRLLDLMDGHHLPAELVVTAPVADAWHATAGDLVERVRRGPHVVSYTYGPPHPVCFPGEPNRRLVSLDRTQRRAALRRLETHGWDPTTGEVNASGSGGYARVKEVFGQAPGAVLPDATTPLLRDDHLAVLRDLGARVVDLGADQPPSDRHPLQWRDGLLVRPCDVDLTTVARRRTRRNPRRDRGLYWWNHAGQDLLGDPTHRLRGHLQRMPPDRICFAQIGIHDYDVYALFVPWWLIYYETWHVGRVRRPPFTVPPRLRRRTYREHDADGQQAIWQAYEKVVSTVARNAQIRVVTSRDLVAMVAGPPDDADTGLVPARLVLPPKDTWTPPPPGEIPPTPQTRLLTAVFLQAEPSRAFVTDEAYFRAKARLCEELAELLHRHDARLTVQADVELALGAQTFDKDLIRRLREKHGVEFSLRTPLRPQPGTPLDQFLGELRRRKETFEGMGSGPVTDLCGGFDLEDPWVLARLGFRTQSAMRNPFTGRSCGRFYVHPWRVSKASPLTDEVTWARPDAEGPIVFLPGQGTFGPRSVRTLRERIYPSLARALGAAQVARPNTWYFLTHVDSFRSLRGASLADYMAGPEHQEHLKVYEKILNELFDPLVKKKYVRWATPSEMHKSFLWWDQHRF